MRMRRLRFRRTARTPPEVLRAIIVQRSACPYGSDTRRARTVPVCSWPGTLNMSGHLSTCGSTHTYQVVFTRTQLGCGGHWLRFPPQPLFIATGDAR